MSDFTIFRRSAGFLASTVLSALVAAAGWTGEANAAACLADAYGGDVNCTANDISIANITVTNVLEACDGTAGDTFTFDGTLNVDTTASNRYDIGFYIGTDPELSTDDDCSVTVIPPSVLDLDGDLCGDTSGGLVNVPVTGVTAPCQDGDGDGFFDVNTCSSWKQGADNDCADPSQALPGTKSKCNCEVVATDEPVPHCSLPEYADRCDDGNPCTDDICNSIASGLGDLFGCTNVNNSDPCDDGLFCNGIDTCANGGCNAHAGDPCAEGGVCGNVCDEEADSCLVEAGTLCRASAGICDTPEECTGSSEDCPADAFDSGTTCRDSAGVCDTAEVCSGSSADCPADGFVASSVVCRADAGDCDVAETCTGSTADCPDDVFEAPGTACASDDNSCTDDECDGEGTCQNNPNTDPCDDGLFCNGDDTCAGGSCSEHTGSPCASGGVCGNTCNEETDDCFDATGTVCRAATGVCDVAETCSGESEDCPADVLLGGETTCRASGGVCDIAEVCTGSSAECPADGVVDSGTTCRASGGVCDVAETCTGSSATCPANGFVNSGTTCRASGGVCDLAETCTGSSATCPTDGFVSSGTNCRASAGVCDVAETCTGSSATCPANGFAGSGTVCRADAGDCDVAETCTGSSASCPADAFEPEGTACTSDGNVCTTDQCNGSGVCENIDNTVPCDDGLFCTVDDTCGNGECNGTPRVCSDPHQCTVNSCNEATDSCQFTPDNDLCEDEDICTTDICDVEVGCRHIFSCEDICRSTNFYAKRSGGDDNVVQDILDAAGGLEVCGEFVTETSIGDSVEGLGLDSALEGLCVRVQHIDQRALYRELVATALNCAMSGSGGDEEFCDEVVRRFVDVDFSDCSDLCAEGALDSSAADYCIESLRCYNNGGEMKRGKCAYGTCDVSRDFCGGDYGTCPPIGVVGFPLLQVCERFSDNCRDERFCQEGLEVCPGRLPPSGRSACRDAKRNDCTIDDCFDDD